MPAIEFGPQPDEAYLDYCEELTGKRPATKKQANVLLSQRAITEADMRLNAHEALAGIKWHVRRGDKKCCMFMLSMFLGQPDKPFKDKVQSMGLDELNRKLYELVLQSGGTEAEALEMIGGAVPRGLDG